MPVISIPVFSLLEQIHVPVCPVQSGHPWNHIHTDKQQGPSGLQLYIGTHVHVIVIIRKKINFLYFWYYNYRDIIEGVLLYIILLYHFKWNYDFVIALTWRLSMT